VSLGDQRKATGMFYSWMGLGLQCLEKAKDAQRYLTTSLEIGREDRKRQGHRVCMHLDVHDMFGSSVFWMMP